MAIQVNGTTVIDNSRNLQNVQGIKTINNTSILGSGNISAGASTSYGAVGTYVIAMITYSGTTVTSGSTHSGSNLRYHEDYQSGRGLAEEVNSSSVVSSGLSGTWRMMGGRIFHYSNGDWYGALFVRIS